MKVEKYFLIVGFGLALILVSCEKQDLSAHKGAKGEQGTIGEDGENGKGYDLLIKDFTLTDADYQDDTAVVQIPQLDRSYLDSGIVMTYFKEDSLYIPMPHRIRHYSSLTVKALYKPGAVAIIWMGSTGFGGFKDYDFRLVAAKAADYSSSLMLIKEIEDEMNLKNGISHK